MNRVGKPVFFVVLALILVFSALSFVGIHTQNGDITKTIIKGAGDIRWGIDIRGGVDVTFTPEEGYTATEAEMNAAENIIKTRLVNLNITDYEVYTDVAKNRIIVRFPWKEGETEFNPERAIEELGETAMLSFREGLDYDYATGGYLMPETIVLQGSEVEGAEAGYTTDEWNNSVPAVFLKLNAEGTQKFAEATARLTGQQISIWMDDMLLSAPVVQTVITGGEASITGVETIDAAVDLANKITAGALPFKLVTENYSTISPTMGLKARDAMVLAGVIAFVLIFIMMVALYRLPGVVAVFTLLAQISLMIASISRFFGGAASFTLTLPGIAGIILSIGMGVDANVITAERIKEELRSGKTLDGAIHIGYKRALSAIIDGNITVIIVAVILMGAFGPPGSLFGTILKPFFFMFGPATAGNIYSFGYTLLMGVIFNFVNILLSRLMIKSISRYAPMRKVRLYGGVE